MALLQPPPLPVRPLDRPTQKHLHNVYLSLRRGQLRGSTKVAHATATALRRVISGAKFSTLDDLSNAIRLTGAWLQDARRGEQCITNITLRTLHLLAEEAGALMGPQHHQHGGSSLGPSRSGSVFPPSTPAAPASLTPSGSFIGGERPAVSSPLSSPPATTDGSRPPFLSRDSRYFAQGSTFSISDLVAAGQNSSSSAAPSMPGSVYGSGANTPALGGSSQASFGFAASSAAGPGSFGAHTRDVSFASASDALHEEDGEEEDDEAQTVGEEDEDEDDEDDEDEDPEETLDTDVKPSTGPSGSVNAAELKPLLIQAVQELLDELESTRTNIARDARDHIHGGETVLTLGHSLTVEVFLKQAAKDRTFTVLVADNGSSAAATRLAKQLPKGIQVVSIPHSSIHTLLPRVTKVLLSPHAVLANGGLLAAPGSAAASMAAKLQATPVLALTGLHKLCADWRWVAIASSSATSGAAGGEGFGGSAGQTASSTSLAGDSYSRPSLSLDHLTSTEDGESLSAAKHLLTSEWDYVEPSGVDVLITNTGEYPGSYVYRLLDENQSLAHTAAAVPGAGEGM
ncbi:nagb/rpia/CoA transferase-like protein [Jaminaea rosea]|uniref:Translation initiation factor eIF2B subunit beta n=1 Tax=Jaminaea rosea TaxID=1569628 RepID=A0A316UPA3_9BASI|nr:nagb/rpia/CoA transferase-like protein [Jaminaea rosea]PWN27126.1 nagb/rpia/CoA transferase-like protein [Jaminaea rosea]